MRNQEISKQSDNNAVHFVAPRIEVSETETSIWLAADMPGVGPNGANIEVNGDVLVLEGAVEKNEGREPRHYRRQFTLSDPALFDLEKIAAKMSHGVLDVEIPKAAKPQPRQIKITTG